MRAHFSELRDQIKQLELSIEKYRKFGGSDNDIRKMLGLAVDFYSDQGKPDRFEKQEIDLEGNCRHPFEN